MANSSEYSLHAPNPNDNSTYILIYVCDVCVAVVFMRYLNLRGHMYLFFFYLFIITMYISVSFINDDLVCSGFITDINYFCFTHSEAILCNVTSKTRLRVPQLIATSYFK